MLGTNMFYGGFVDVWKFMSRLEIIGRAGELRRSKAGMPTKSFK